MANHADQSDNHRKLVEAGVLPEDAKLTPEEDTVIEGMSDSEVKTLIDLRARLTDERQKSGLEDTSEQTSANFLV